MQNAPSTASLRDQTLFSELPGIYSSTREDPNVIRMRIRMRDLIDPDVLRSAVDTTMSRYPYFRVRLLRDGDGGWIYAANDRPVTVNHSLNGVTLNSPESNYHMVAFSWYDNRITLDIFHALTDGKGSYELLRTLLYYYCSGRYRVTLPEAGIRLAGSDISEEEWTDPVASAPQVCAPASSELTAALRLTGPGRLKDDHRKVVYSIAVPESEFMRFNIEHDGSPATMVSLFLSRAIARLFPDAAEPIRVRICVNQRTALHKPLAHQCLVGAALVEYKDAMRAWPLRRQATAYRGMVYAQTQEDTVLAGVSSDRDFVHRVRSLDTDWERVALLDEAMRQIGCNFSATVSYIGKANFREAEQYIRDFRTWTSTTTAPLILELSAVNGRFTIEFIQTFSDPALMNALLAELDENGIRYDLQDVTELSLPNVILPWTE